MISLPPDTTGPYLSVIIPAHNGAHVLPLALDALDASTLGRATWELIVVDDASTDLTAMVAAERADTIVRLPGAPHGPAYARNRGFEVSRGEVVVFIDADVCVHPNALAEFASLFKRESAVGAAFGSYDSRPPAAGFISQYRNLLHHYHHQINAGDAETFWAGCGAVRAEIFASAKMYDEWHFPRPQIEDIELGNRIRALGHRIMLRPDIQCAHLKRWTFRSMILTDLKDRGVPWARLLVAQGSTLKSGSLNVKMVEKISTAFIWIMLAFLIAAAAYQRAALLAPAIVCLLPVIWWNRPLYGFFERERGFLFALRVVPVHVLYYILNGIAAGFGWFLHELIGGPSPDPMVEAVAEIGLKTWPPVPVRRRRWS
jgi:glycosyltransferase involved in cell wall biosynthesis